MLIVIRLTTKSLSAKLAHKCLICVNLAMRSIIAQIFVAFATIFANKHLFRCRNVASSLHCGSGDGFWLFAFAILLLFRLLFLLIIDHNTLHVLILFLHLCFLNAIAWI